MAIVEPGKGRTVIDYDGKRRHKPMTVIVPDYHKVGVQDDGTDLRITMRVTAPPFVSTVFGLLLAVFVSAEIGAINALVNGGLREGEHFQLPWMTEAISNGPDFEKLMLTWFAFGAVAVILLTGMFLWSCVGREIIELNAATLKHIRRISILSFGREYSVAKITHLRLVPFPWNKERNFSLFGFKNGIIAFNYGRRTYRLGAGIDEANAHYVIQEMRTRVKSLCSADA